MDIVTLGAALNGSAEYVNSHFKGGSNIQIVNNPDGTQTINASGEVSAEDTVARADIAAIKDGESIDSFADVETALGSKQDTISDLSTIRSGAALGATAVQPETGKGLSTNDYTTTEKTKLAGIAEGAEVNVQANWTQTTTTADDYIKNKPTLGTAAALDVAASGNASTSQVVKGNDTRLTDARNAADVSSWAKAANKPSYNGSEIALTGYTEAQSKSSVAATDTANAAIGKLEYRVDTNENNILFNTNNGVKNVAPLKSSVNTGSANITFVQNADKSYTLTISATTSANIGFDISDTFTLESTMQYVLSGNPSAGAVRLVLAEGTSPYSWIDQQYGDNPKTITPVANKLYKLSVFIYANTSATTLILKPMMCPKSLYDADSTYQPYALSNAAITPALKECADNGVKNILPVTLNSGTINNVTFTVNADKSISTSGTASANITNAYINLSFKLPTSGQWVLVGCAAGGSSESTGSYRIDMLDGNQTGSVIVADTGNGVVFTPSQFQNTTACVRLRIGDGANMNNKTFKPMIIPKALYDAGFTEYQPYALSNVELTDKEQANENNILYNTFLGRKNALKLQFNAISIRGLTFTKNADGTLTVAGTYNGSDPSYAPYIGSATLPAGTYMLSGCPAGGGESTWQLDMISPSYINDTGSGAQFTLTQTTTIQIRCRIATRETLSQTFYPMITLKSIYDTDSTFERYAMSNAEITDWIESQ